MNKLRIIYARLFSPFIYLFFCSGRVKMRKFIWNGVCWSKWGQLHYKYSLHSVESGVEENVSNLPACICVIYDQATFLYVDTLFFIGIFMYIFVLFCVWNIRGNNFYSFNFEELDSMIGLMMFEKGFFM